jgi:hypothetical protein
MGNPKQIREAVEEELSRDPLIDAAGITVWSGQCAQPPAGGPAAG